MGLKYRVEEKFFHTIPVPEIVSRCFGTIILNSVVDIDTLVSKIIGAGMEIDPLSGGILKVFVDKKQRAVHKADAGIKLQYHST